MYYVPFVLDDINIYFIYSPIQFYTSICSGYSRGINFKVMKKLLLALLILISVSAKAQIAEDSIYTYHSGIIVENHVTHATDEFSRFYFYSDGQHVESMRAHMLFTNYVADFSVDSITMRQQDTVNSYLGVTGNFHIDGAVYPGSILIVRELNSAKRTIFLYIKQNIYTFYN